MRFILISILIISLLILACLLLLGRYSRHLPLDQLSQSELAPCPKTANCVCSEHPQDQDHFVEAIDLSQKPDLIDLSQIAVIVVNMGGEIVIQQSDYLSATFKSGIFGFVDDFEIRLDHQSKMLHLRSASRVGRSDLGANSRRVVEFKKEFDSRI